MQHTTLKQTKILLITYGNGNTTSKWIFTSNRSHSCTLEGYYLLPNVSIQARPLLLYLLVGYSLLVSNRHQSYWTMEAPHLSLLSASGGSDSSLSTGMIAKAGEHGQVDCEVVPWILFPLHVVFGDSKDSSATAWTLKIKQKNIGKWA